jgi:hypothetical protein
MPAACRGDRRRILITLAVSRHLRVLRKAAFVQAEVSGRERCYRLLAPAQAEAYLAELRVPQDAARTHGAPIHALETEVYRVRARSKAARTKPLHERKRKTG